MCGWAPSDLFCSLMSIALPAPGVALVAFEAPEAFIDWDVTSSCFFEPPFEPLRQPAKAPLSITSATAKQRVGRMVVRRRVRRWLFKSCGGPAERSRERESADGTLFCERP